jgi:hypothetical protein
VVYCITISVNLNKKCKKVRFEIEVWILAVVMGVCLFDVAKIGFFFGCCSMGQWVWYCGGVILGKFLRGRCERWDFH